MAAAAASKSIDYLPRPSAQGSLRQHGLGLRVDTRGEAFTQETCGVGAAEGRAGLSATGNRSRATAPIRPIQPGGVIGGMRHGALVHLAVCIRVCVYMYVCIGMHMHMYMYVYVYM